MSENAPRFVSEFNTGLPRQEHSSTAWAALKCRHYLEETPIPPEFQLTRKRCAEAEPGQEPESRLTHRVPYDMQTGLIWDAYYQLRTVTVLFDESELLGLREAERAELLAANGWAPSHIDSALPRKWALTLLIRDVSLVKTASQFLLNAMAYLASFRSADQDQLCEPAARDVRLTILTNHNARLYAGAHAVSLREHELITLVLVHVDETGKLAAQKVHLNGTLDTGKKAFCAIMREVAGLFEAAGIADETPPALFRAVVSRSSDIANAYENALQSTNNEFWGQLVRMDATANMDYKLCARNITTYLKIADKGQVNNSPKGLANEHVFFGGLMHKKGQEQAVERFLMEVLTNEFNTEMTHHPGKTAREVIVGLRYADRNVNDRNLGLHILEVQWEFHSLKNQLSSFGRLAVPGSSVCGEEFPCAIVPRLVYKLKAFNQENYGNFFVLPCSDVQTLPMEECYAKTMWNAFNIGLKMCWDRFCDKECVTVPPPRPLKARKPSDEPSTEDKCLSSMGGMPMYGAFRIGDVLKHVSTCPVPMFSAFLTSGLRRLGPCTSMSDLYKSCGELHDLVVKLEADKRELEQAVTDAQADAAKLAGPPPIEPSKKEAVTRAIKGLNVMRGGHMLFKGSDTDATRFLTLISLSRSGKSDAPTSQETWDAVSQLVVGLPDNVLEHLSTVARHVHPDYFIVVVMVTEDRLGKFMLNAPGDNEWKQVTLERAIENHGNPGTLYFQYYEKQKKLHPLVATPAGQ